MNQYKVIVILFLYLSISGISFAQVKHSISGEVRDARSGEELIGASVYIPGLKVGVSTNAYGYYSINLPEGKYEVEFSYVGYEKTTKEIELSKNIRLVIELKEAQTKLKEVLVSSDKAEQLANVQQNKMSVIKLDIKQIRKIPILLGELDVIKAMQLLPGIQSAGDGNTLSVVRGGNIDHNLVLLDEATVYNPSHVVGLFSVFNGDAIKEFEIYKGGIPAQYGGRIASVLDIRMKEGNAKSFEGNAGIGLLTSRLNLEGPINKGKGSFMLSGRRTYFDVFLQLSDKTKDVSAFFYDLNLKANYTLSDKDKVFLSAYFGQDKIGLSSLLGFGWNNTTTTVRWNHLFNNRLFSNTSFIYSQYNYDFNLMLSPSLSFDRNNFIRDYSMKSDFNYFVSPKSNIKFGFNETHHTFQPGQRIPLTSESSNLAAALQEKKAWEQGFYVSHSFKTSAFLTFEYGIRLSMFSNFGGINEYQYLNNQTTYIHDGVTMPGTVTSIQHITDDKIYNTFVNPEPRLNLTYNINSFSSIKASYNRMVQYMHLIQNTTSSTGQEFWVPSDRYILPQIGDQVAAGYFRNFFNNTIEASAEVYYKSMQNTPEIIDNADLQFKENIESQIKRGEGRSYGLELFVRKQNGRLTGWIGYTLSKSERRAEGINNYEWYNYRFDRRNYLTCVVSYDISDKLSFSSNFIYATGDAYTGAIGQYQINVGQLQPNDKTITLYGPRNSLRVPDYHRLDFSFTWKKEPFKNHTKGIKKYIRESYFIFSVYNAYARKNVYSIDYKADENGQASVYKTYLFTIVPSITYNFKF